MTHIRLRRACTKAGAMQTTGFQVLTRTHTMTLGNRQISWVEQDKKAVAILCSVNGHHIMQPIRTIKAAVAFLLNQDKTA